jgi:uncharacterized protein YodC (DUF2158 family)
MGVSTKLERIELDPAQLELIEPALDRPPLLSVGSTVQLRSGGPAALVVDLSGDRATIAWQSSAGAEEASLDARCLRSL